MKCLARLRRGWEERRGESFLRCDTFGKHSATRGGEIVCVGMGVCGYGSMGVCGFSKPVK